MATEKREMRALRSWRVQPSLEVDTSEVAIEECAKPGTVAIVIHRPAHLPVRVFLTKAEFMALMDARYSICWGDE